MMGFGGFDGGAAAGTFALGSLLWPRCYGDNSHNDRAAIEALGKLIDENMPKTGIGPGDPGSELRLDPTTGATTWTVDESITHLHKFAAKWVDGACRTMRADSKYFAAMAQTKSGEAREDLLIPWPAFAVHIPPGLIVDSDGVEYSFAAFAQFQDVLVAEGVGGPTRVAHVASLYMIAADNGTTIHAYWPDMSLADLLCGPDPENDDRGFIRERVSGLEETGSDARIRELVKRATVGMLYTLQHTNNWKFGGYFDRAGNGSRCRDGAPPHRTILIGCPISIDVRGAVRADAMAGSRAAPSVQTLVRGHLKRQVIGMGRSGRKVIWIEPYWRGPENAPILARPVQVHK